MKSIFLLRRTYSWYVQAMNVLLPNDFLSSLYDFSRVYFLECEIILLGKFPFYFFCYRKWMVKWNQVLGLFQWAKNKQECCVSTKMTNSNNLSDSMELGAISIWMKWILWLGFVTWNAFHRMKFSVRKFTFAEHFPTHSILTHNSDCCPKINLVRVMISSIIPNVIKKILSTIKWVPYCRIWFVCVHNTTPFHASQISEKCVGISLVQINLLMTYNYNKSTK